MHLVYPLGQYESPSRLTRHNQWVELAMMNVLVQQRVLPVCKTEEAQPSDLFDETWVFQNHLDALKVSHSIENNAHAVEHT